MSQFKRVYQVRLPFDMRSSDESKNYGIAGLRIWFVLIGPKGAVQFLASFPAYLPHVDREYVTRFPDWNDRKTIEGYDVGYHSPTPMYDGQPAMGPCEHLDGRPCYYDGSGLRADEWAKEIFSVRGQDPEPLIWKRLEAYYECLFNDAEVRSDG